MQHLILDSDGVLVDSFDFHLKRINAFLETDITPKEYRDIHDGNFYDNTLDKLDGMDFIAYADLVAEEQSRLPLYPGVSAVLSELKERYLIHLVTSGWKQQVEPMLKRNDIYGLFSQCLFADSGKSKHDKLATVLREEKASPENCIFVTDTLGDLLEAEMVGISTIAVTFGFHDEARLRKGNPDHVAHSWKDIHAILRPHTS